MIRCLPKGICSWNFILEGDGRHATLKLNWGSEQGAITADGTDYKVRKHGFFSGDWSLDQGPTSVVSGKQPDALIRSFEIQNAQETLLLRAESASSRNFLLERSEEVIAKIIRDHGFTRRANIEPLVQDLDFPTLAFAFFLVAITWRRSAKSAAANTGG